MGRGISARQIRELINQLRTRIKGLFLRTTIIVGFPGESESDFRELLDFLQEIKFERLGAFQYSDEKGIPATRLKPKISSALKKDRFDAIMSLQQQIAFKQNKELVDNQIKVIIDNKVGKRFVGRTYGDAPEVDGNIYLKETGLTIGQIYNAQVTDTKDYDLIGRTLKR